MTVIAVLCGSCHRGYDTVTCENISRKIETGRPLGQDDYARMIDQSGHILRYLIDAVDGIRHCPAADRQQAASALRADPEFLERFGYMFTFSSVLYRAHLAGLLDSKNTAGYEALDLSTERYARLCEAI